VDDVDARSFLDEQALSILEHLQSVEQRRAHSRSARG
jgi:hypothetical protein